MPDDIDAIAAEVRAASEAHTAVVVAGGVGPTEDDLTLAALASAFSVPLARDPDLEARLRRYFSDKGQSVPEAALKMADAPAGVRAVEVFNSNPALSPREKVEDGEGGQDANAAAAAATPPRPSPFPLLAFRNCFVLPGSPTLLRRKWPALERELVSVFGECAPFTAVSLRLSLEDECGVAPALEAAAKASGGRARAGSYPLQPPTGDGAGVVLVLEGKDAAAVAACVAAAIAALPAGCVLAQEEGGRV